MNYDEENSSIIRENQKPTSEFFTELKIMKTIPIKPLETKPFNSNSESFKIIPTEILEQKPEEIDINEKFKKEVFILNWLDYSMKYGIGYSLSDRSIGVHFNDSTKILLKEDNFFFYIEKSKNSTTDHFSEYHIENCPPELQKKLMLLKYFQNYLVESFPVSFFLL